MVEIKNVTFNYNNSIEELTKAGIRDIELFISKGECVLLCGQSGCGKSTITKLINGLIPNFDNGTLTGSIVVDGINTNTVPLYEIAKHTSSVFQNPKSQFFNTDAESEVVFALENQGIEKSEINRRLENTIQKLEIASLMKKNLFQMSGGEKQIIAFASAYISDANIVILDEPSANLDLYTINKIRTIIKGMKEQGKTMIIAEHRISYLKGLLDTIYYIKDGYIKKRYSANEFFAMKEIDRIELGLRQFSNSSKIQIQKQSFSSGEYKNVFKIENIHISYKEKMVLSRINCTITSGDIVGIIGNNGIGKSSLLRCLCGIHKEESGTIYFNGNPYKAKKRRQICGFVMQDVNYQLFAESVIEECLLGNTDVSEEEINNILTDFKLIELKQTHPQCLSGGQKQRLAIAVAIASGKQILILDEPTSGLDYNNMIILSKTLDRLSKKGIICIVVTHDMEFLQTTCNRCLKLNTDGIKEIQTIDLTLPLINE